MICQKETILYTASIDVFLECLESFVQRGIAHNCLGDEEYGALTCETEKSGSKFEVVSRSFIPVHTSNLQY